MCRYLEIDFLTKYCEEFLSKNLRPEVCVGVWQFSRDYKLTDLAAKSYNMVIEDIDKVSRNELVALPKSILLILLSLQKKLSMDEVCKIILSWLDADKHARAIHLSELLPFVSFPLLTSGYLSDLTMYYNHELRDIIFEYVNEGLSFHLKGLSGRDENVQRQILAKQSVLELKSYLVTPRAVVIGGMLKDGKPLKNVYALDLEKNQKCSLAPVPSNMGLHFASCTWRNEVYLSGGNLLPNFFAVYKPGGNEWEVLPEIPGEGRWKHAMASVSSNVYVLGGFGKWATFEQFPLEVLKYDIKSQKWSEVCKLPSNVEEASAAVLGHRIYLFGGSKYRRGDKSDLVQCVDTLSKVAYIAGRLPSPSCGSRAFSNGGIIWVLLPTGEVLQMHENFELAEQREQILAAGTQKMNISPTVGFTKLMNFSTRCHFGASFLMELARNNLVWRSKSQWGSAVDF